MPTYQYACTACDHAFEQFQSFAEDSLTECPECSGRLRKVFNAVGVVFKGSGFYRTDSRAASANGDATKSHHESHNGSKPEAAKAQSAKSETSTKTESSPSAKKTSDSTSAA